jgi:hypothetical protein
LRQGGIRAWNLFGISGERRKEGYSDTHDLCQGGIREGIRVLFGWIAERRRYNAAQKGEAVT